MNSSRYIRRSGDVRSKGQQEEEEQEIRRRLCSKSFAGLSFMLKLTCVNSLS